MLFGRKQKDQRSDEELLELYKRRGSPSIIESLFIRHYHKVYGLCLNYLKNAHDAEDALMEIFEELPAKIRTYQIEHFESWLFSVSRNFCLKRFKQKTRERTEELHEIYADFFVESAPNEDHTKEERRYELLSDAIDQLKEGQRQCIVLFYLENQSYQEISQLTAYGLNEIKSHIQNGKRNLKNLLLKLT